MSAPWIIRALRCEPRSRLVVRAWPFDNHSSLDDMVTWIRAASADPQARVDAVTSDGSILIREHADGSTRETLLRRGDVAIQAPSSRFGWDAMPSETFRTTFTVLPRECPVYASHDPAE